MAGGGNFTIADFNVVSVLSKGMLFEPNLSAAPAVRAWFKRCPSWPAVANLRGRKQR